jgi:hypothetical protein
MSADIDIASRGKATNILMAASLGSNYSIRADSDTQIRGCRFTSETTADTAEIFLLGDRNLVDNCSLSAPEVLGLLVEGWWNQVRNVSMSGGSLSDHYEVTGNNNQLDVTSITGGNGGDSATGAIKISGDENRVTAQVTTPSVNGIVVTGDLNHIQAHFNELTPAPDNSLDLVRLTSTASRNVVTDCVVVADSSGNKFRSGVHLGASTACNWVVGNNLGAQANYGTGAIDDNGTNNQLTWIADATFGDNFTDCPP